MQWDSLSWVGVQPYNFPEFPELTQCSF
uniref:Uncharacterized protein n=1 Tax=Rhizophora mucronata TaxID=61149 RepID=A0A2P2QIX5_RHIMU